MSQVYSQLKGVVILPHFRFQLNDIKRCFKYGVSNPVTERPFDKAPYLQIKALISR